MRNSVLLMLFILTFLNQSVFAASFGPRENRLIYEGDKGYISYRIDNTDNSKVWLVQSWVEDSTEKRTDKFTSVPVTFRVEPLSTFNVRVMKTGALPEDRESIFWIVSNSIPGGEKVEDEKKDDSISAKLSLAYRFKVPMIYRPKSIQGMKSQPELLKWSIGNNGKIKVENPTRFAIQLHNIDINGKISGGNGISYIILPMSSVTLEAKGGTGTRIKYGIVNDYGAVKDYEGIIK
ncbi:TPA: molecular chaperone [Yersinia enterocolitica]|nr:molecular chaperone [Yersinia enterocolitica]